MGLFTSKQIQIYEKKGARAEWSAVKTALKNAGLRTVHASAYDVEQGVLCCGAGLDNRNFGKNGRIDRKMYSICVRPEDEAQARQILQQILQQEQD